MHLLQGNLYPLLFVQNTHLRNIENIIFHRTMPLQPKVEPWPPLSLSVSCKVLQSSQSQQFICISGNSIFPAFSLMAFESFDSIFLTKTLFFDHPPSQHGLPIAAFYIYFYIWVTEMTTELIVLPNPPYPFTGQDLPQELPFKHLQLFQ